MTSSRNGVRGAVAAVAAGMVALTSFVLGVPTAQAATTATPTKTAILAAASYATTTFHDEWDFSNTTDLLLDNTGPAMNISGAKWSGGVLSYTAGKSSYVSPVWGGYPGSLYQNRDGGLAANHIAASSYNRVSIHAYSSANVSSAIQWFNSTELNGAHEGGQPFELLKGWHEYDITLDTNKFPNLPLNWTGTIEGIRFATSPTANTSITLDFMRLYKAGADANARASWTVSGDPVQPYWSSNGATSCPAPSQSCGPVQDASGTVIPAATGTITADASAYPAGTTLFLGSAAGAGIPSTKITVQPRPQPIVDSPSAAGCGDFATSTFGHPWLASSATVSVRNAKNVKLSGGKLSATNTSNDPNVYFSTGSSGIDASFWRYLSVTESYSGSFNLLDQPGGGTMARALWASSGRPLSESQDLLTYTDRPTITVDLGMSASTLVESTASVRYGWGGRVTSFRWDPNEDPGARNWTLSNVTLGRTCETSSSGYAVTWHDPGWVSGTTAKVEAVKSGVVQVLGTVTEKSGTNSLTVHQAVAPVGDYTIRVVSTSPTAGVTGTGNSATPLRITVPATRVAGADRYATSVQASRTEFPKGATHVLIAGAGNYPDALSAAPAAASVHGPLLLAGPSSLPTSVSNELKRLKPKSVYVVGGPSAISAAVLKKIASVTKVTPLRIAGADRYGTSAAIAQHFFPTTVPSAFVASSGGFPDALSAASAATRIPAPVLLVSSSAGAPFNVVAAQLARLRPARIYAVGGTAVLSAPMLSSLAKRAPTTRLAGADRFATSVAVGKQFNPGTAKTAVLASGLNFPDALVGSVLSGVKAAPLYLVQNACIPTATLAELARLRVTSLTVMGGTAVMSSAVLDDRHC